MESKNLTKTKQLKFFKNQFFKKEVHYFKNKLKTFIKNFNYNKEFKLILKDINVQ